MKKIILFICLIPILSTTAQELKLGRKPEETSSPDYGIKFSGFVKNDFFGDSHEVVAPREGHFLLYPANDVIDAQGKIVNNEPSFNFLSIQSRLTGKITGPDFFKAKTSGMIEADFFGNENTSFSDVNGFRLRHAVAKLNWTNFEILTGQYWHPLFVTDCSPGVISFNTGAPFQAFGRSPQIRLTEKIDDVKLLAAFSSQRDFTNTGGSSELRNSAIPDMNAQIHFGHLNDSTKNEYLFGVGFELKALNPRLTNTVGGKLYKVHERVISKSLMAFAKYKTNKFSIKAQGLLGENLTDLMMIGGYVAVEETSALTGELSYIPLKNAAGWIDLNYTLNKSVDAGLFAGYTKNLGAKEDIIYASLTSKTRGSNIDKIYRVAPRVVVTSGKFKIAAELEYTAAAYAKKDWDTSTATITKLYIDGKGKVIHSQNVNNTRALLSVIYNF